MAAEPLLQRTTPRAAAADWLNLRRSGDMMAEDMRAFQRWLDADPANEAAYEQLERLWGALASAADDPRVMAAAEDARRRFRGELMLRWGAVAAGVVAFVGAWSLVAPGAETARSFVPAIGPAPAEFQTSVGQRTTVTLPDHSIVTLDTDTILRVHDKPGQRLVTLKRGRAFFRVAKDPSRPFIVTAGGHRVRALGTAFDVRVGPREFEVTLIEGRVKVETPSLLRVTATTAQLRPGQRLDVEGSKPQLSHVDLKSETTWHEGRLTFARDSLADAVAEMNRYSEKKIVFRDGAPDKSIVGVFRAGDVDSFAKALVMNGIASVTAESENAIELSAN